MSTAAYAREYLTVAELAAMIGVSPATVKAPHRDPTRCPRHFVGA
jgi:hypothetical protein